MKKKIFAAVIAAVLLLGCLALSASAEGSAPELWVRKVPGNSNALVFAAYFAWFGEPPAGAVPTVDGDLFLGDSLTIPLPDSIAGAATCYFPLVKDGRILQCYGVSSERLMDISSAADTELAQKLNAFIGDTSAEKPLLWYFDENDDCVLISEHRTETVLLGGTNRARGETAPRDYDTLLHANDGTETGQISVNILQPARIVFGGPLATGSWALKIALWPLSIDIEIIE